MENEDSFKKRYLYKLIVNIGVIPFSIIIQMIAPRALGPSTFGNFTYLTSFFTNIFNFFDGSTSLAFYTKLSQSQKNYDLINFYWRFAFISACLVFFWTTSVISLGYNDLFFPGQEIIYIALGFLVSLLTWYLSIMTKIVDAHALTAGGEIVRLLQRIFAGSLIICLFWLDSLTLTSFYYFHLIIISFFIIGTLCVLRRRGVHAIPYRKLSLPKIKFYGKDFYTYCSPIVLVTVVSILCNLIDRWILQKFAGAVQQGFFGLSLQIGAGCFLFTNAMSPLLVREFSINFSKGNLPQMRNHFLQIIPALYTLTAFFSIFFSFHAREVALIFGGPQFINAQIPIAIMTLLPIHQTYGQLSGSVFYATGQTALYRNISVSMLLLGIIMTGCFFIPHSFRWSNSGATVLAVKTVSLQLLGVNIQLWFNCKTLGIKFRLMLKKQGISFVTLLAATALAHQLAQIFDNTSWMVRLFVSGICYTCIVSLIIFKSPATLGLSPENLYKLKRLFKRELP